MSPCVLLRDEFEVGGGTIMGKVITINNWFDYCKIANQSESLGAGGYIDKRDNDYMWAETQIYEIGLDNKTLSEILQYIEDIKNTYQDYKLYPAFYIAEWKSN